MEFAEPATVSRVACSCHWLRQLASDERLWLHLRLREGHGLYVVADDEEIHGEDATVIQRFQGGRWEILPSCPRHRAGTAAVAWRGRLYLIGGTFNADGSMEDGEAAVDVFNPATRKWTIGPPMGVRRMWAAAAVCGDTIVVAGGHHDDRELNDVEQFDGQMWTAMPPMRVARERAHAFVLGDAIHVAGGYTDDDGPNTDADGTRIGATRTVERFDSSVGVWELIEPMDRRRFMGAAASVGDAMYVAGGYAEFSVLEPENDPAAQLECFKNNTWTLLPRMPFRCWGRSVGGVVNGAIWVIGGFDSGLGHDRRSRVVWIFNPATGTWTNGPALPRTVDNAVGVHMTRT